VGLNRKYLFLGIDLFWVALSPFAALFIRDNFAPREAALTAAILYACIGVAVAAIVFPVAGLNRALWRYTSLGELVRLLLAVTVTVLLALLATFAHTRLLDISRSLPLLQWFFLVAAMTGTRLAIRVYRERSAVTGQQFVSGGDTKQVLIVGVNRLAEVYLRAIAEFGAHEFSVVGFLANGTDMHGRLLRSYKVLGLPEDLLKVTQQLEVHGTWLDRIVVAEDLKRLSPGAQQALLNFERSSDVKVVWLPELLGFGSTSDEVIRLATVKGSSENEGPTLPLPGRRYRYPKRLLDLFAAGVLLVITAPLFVAITFLIAIDVGLPVVFWQNRPGRFGRPFKLYKFRTMRAAHDEQGDRIPDQDRVSKFGALVRLSRLDEFPQLYNILVGEMSFVGPRPLLVTDHESGTQDRLLVRPGLTGWAQVNGGRKLDPEDKAALDIWYVAHLSLNLDFRIALRTVLLLFSGERINHEAVRAAREARPMGDGASGALAAVPQRAKVAATVQSAA
jgi:lipopolysaccharide/colanic/teichoic acid biosynthesis glycosyltransferase